VEPSTFTITVMPGKVTITATVTDQMTIDSLLPVMTAIKPLLAAHPPTTTPTPTP